MYIRCTLHACIHLNGKQQWNTNFVFVKAINHFTAHLDEMLINVYTFLLSIIFLLLSFFITCQNFYFSTSYFQRNQEKSARKQTDEWDLLIEWWHVMNVKSISTSFYSFILNKIKWNTFVTSSKSFVRRNGKWISLTGIGSFFASNEGYRIKNNENTWPFVVDNFPKVIKRVWAKKL